MTLRAESGAARGETRGADHVQRHADCLPAGRPSRLVRQGASRCRHSAADGSFWSGPNLLYCRRRSGLGIRSSRTDQVHGEPYHFQDSPASKGMRDPNATVYRKALFRLSAQQSPGGSLDGVDATAEAAVRELRLPSLSIAIARGSRVLLAKAYGLADLEHEVPASERTIYRIGSITKQFTAAAILRLAEQRKLSLDDEIPRHVPSLQKSGHGVSIRQLLNHTSGIRSFTAIPAFASKERLDLNDDELLAVFQNEQSTSSPAPTFCTTNPRTTCWPW